jgi:hypothetical protein
LIGQVNSPEPTKTSKSVREPLMRSTFNRRGQTSVPTQTSALLRTAASDGFALSVDEKGIHVVPIRQDAIRAFRGQGQGGLVQRLLEDRRRG